MEGEDANGEEATVEEEAITGVKADVKSLQQLSSSGLAAKKKREENHVEKGLRALAQAVQEQFGGGEGDDQENSRSEKA